MEGTRFEFRAKKGARMEVGEPLLDRVRVEKSVDLAVLEMNQLVAHPQHRRVAVDAFRRIVLWDDETEQSASPEFARHLGCIVTNL